jgi:hypothetical protein
LVFAAERGQLRCERFDRLDLSLGAQGFYFQGALGLHHALVGRGLRKTDLADIWLWAALMAASADSTSCGGSIPVISLA